jgi:hypothetical protein
MRLDRAYVAGMRYVLLAVLVAGACHGDEPAPPPSKFTPPPPPPPPAFKLNRGRDVLDARQVKLSGTAGSWAGDWAGKLEMVDGALVGTLPVHMTITVGKNGTIQLVQDELGIRIVQDLVPSPDVPGLAAGVNYDRRSMGEVSMLTRSEQTAVLSGDRITIGMYNEIEDAGTYQGQALPKGPPSKGITTLTRDGAAASTP